MNDISNSLFLFHLSSLPPYQMFSCVHSVLPRYTYIITETAPGPQTWEPFFPSKPRKSYVRAYLASPPRKSPFSSIFAIICLDLMPIGALSANPQSLFYFPSAFPFFYSVGYEWLLFEKMSIRVLSIASLPGFFPSSLPHQHRSDDLLLSFLIPFVFVSSNTVFPFPSLSPFECPNTLSLSLQ